MSKEENNDLADWQKNSGRPSNFNEKDDKLKKDGEGNLKIQKNEQSVSNEDEKSIQDTLDSLSEEKEDKD